MRLLILDTVNKTIEVALAGAVSSAQPHFVSSWADNAGTSFTEGSTDGVLNSTTDVTAVPAPAASTRRVIKSLSVYNADDADVTLLVKYDNGTSQRTLTAVTLDPGDVWTLDGIFTASGLFKQGQDINWGGIGGTLSAQTDLQNALDVKASLSGDIFTGSVSVPSVRLVDEFSTSTGGTFNNLSVEDLSMVFATGINNKTFTGFSDGVDGQILILYINGTDTGDTVRHNSSSSSIGNRLLLSGATDRVLQARDSMIFRYKGSFWYQINERSLPEKADLAGNTSQTFNVAPATEAEHAMRRSQTPDLAGGADANFTLMPQVGDAEIVSEDSYTPVATGTGGSAGSYAASTAEGLYEETANGWIRVVVNILLTNKGSWTGNVHVSLPEVVGSRFMVICRTNNTSLPSGSTTPIVQGLTGNAYVIVGSLTSTGDVGSLDFSNIANNSDIRFECFYKIQE